MRSFVRKIHTFDIEPVHLGDERTGAQVYALNIRGTAFLWHQVSGVGRGKEGGEWGSVFCVHFVHVTRWMEHFAVWGGPELAQRP